MPGKPLAPLRRAGLAWCYRILCQKIFADNLFVHTIELIRSSPIRFLVGSSTGLPFSPILSCAQGTITSGWLTKYMFKKTQLCRRWYWAFAAAIMPTEAPIVAAAQWV